MATVTKAATIEMLGDGLRGARQDIHDLKTHVMGMEDRINERFDGVESRLDGVESRLDGVESRLDSVESKLDRIIDHLENGA